MHGRGFGRQGVLVPAACPRVPGPALTIIAHHMCFSEQKGWTSGGMGWGGDESVPCHCARGDYDSVGQDALRTWSVLWKKKADTDTTNAHKLDIKFHARPWNRCAYEAPYAYTQSAWAEETVSPNATPGGHPWPKYNWSTCHGGIRFKLTMGSRCKTLSVIILETSLSWSSRKNYWCFQLIVKTANFRWQDKDQPWKWDGQNQPDEHWWTYHAGWHTFETVSAHSVEIGQLLSCKQPKQYLQTNHWPPLFHQKYIQHVSMFLMLVIASLKNTL